MTSIPSLGYIFIWSDAPPYSLTCLLGDKTAGPKNGANSYGGWEQVKRKRQRSLTEWLGVDGLVMEIPILIDDFANGKSIENEITQLERMAGRTRPGAPDTEPPLIHFQSEGLVPHDFHRDPTIEWVIEDIEWGDTNRDQYGNRTRQAATLLVVEYVEDDDLAGLTSAQRKAIKKAKEHAKKGKGAKSAKEKRYVVKGPKITMEWIAAHKLGKQSRWHEIKKLNPKLHDPTKEIPAGTVVLLP
jgi:hypothetical protein